MKTLLFAMLLTGFSLSAQVKVDPLEGLWQGTTVSGAMYRANSWRWRKRFRQTNIPGAQDPEFAPPARS